MRINKIALFVILFSLCFTFTVMAQSQSFKRGISYNIPAAADVKELSKSLTWYYNWGHTPPADQDILQALEDYKLDFIPMVWNGNIDKERLRTFYRNNPQIKYILGFNEPNFWDQARMTPTEAASKWPLIEEIADEFGLKIVGPAMNYAPGNGTVTENGVSYTDPFRYLDDFFAACPDCRVDYIAAHCYMNQPSAVKWYLEQYKKYGKPIWLTEFCAWETGVTEEFQKTYMVETLNYLESDPDIYRYAWFIGRSGSTGSYPYMQLLGRRAGELTDLGKLYVGLSSFDKDLYYVVKDTIQAEHYVGVSDGLHLESTTDVSGEINLTDFYASRYTIYNIDMADAGEYTVKFRVASQFEGELSLSVDGNDILTLPVESTGGLSEWKTIEAKITLASGKQQIRINSHKGRVNFNWWLIDDGTISGIEENKELKTIKVYPNPVQDYLNIESDSDVQIILTDLAGKMLETSRHTKVIDFSKYASGIYLLSISDSLGNKEVKRIIKK